MNSNIAGERVVVTGATGYVGSALVGALEESNDVHVLVRDPSKAQGSLGLSADRVHGDPTQPGRVLRLFQTIRPTLVFHLATNYERIDDPLTISDTVEANVTFGSIVLDAASRIEACDVVVSGSHFQFPPDDRTATSFYAATKNALTDIATYMGHVRGLRWIQPVFFDVYGPNDPRSKLVNIFIRNVRARSEIALPDPQPLHHFVFLDDAIAALVSSAVQLRSRVSVPGDSVFVTADELHSPSDVLEVIAAVSGIEPVVSPQPYALPEGSIMMPTEGARPKGWLPKVGLNEGIERIVAALPLV